MDWAKRTDQSYTIDPEAGYRNYDDERDPYFPNMFMKTTALAGPENKPTQQQSKKSGIGVNLNYGR